MPDITREWVEEQHKIAAHMLPQCRGIDLGGGKWSGCSCDCPTCAAARTGYPFLLRDWLRLKEENEQLSAIENEIELKEQNRRLREVVAEVRYRMVVTFSTGANPSAQRWWACHMCSWTWKEGEKPLHESTCPLQLGYVGERLQDAPFQTSVSGDWRPLWLQY